MKIKKRKVIIDDHKLDIEVAIMSKTDAKTFKRLFDLWKRFSAGTLFLQMDNFLDE